MSPVRRKTHSLRALAAVASGLGLALGGCKSPDFGDTLASWVRANGASLSVRQAEATLPARWVTAQELTYLSLRARGELLFESLRGFPAQDSPVPEDLGRAIETSQEDLRAILSLESEILLLRQAHERWRGACASRELFERSDLRKAGLLPPLALGSEDPNFVVFVSTDGLSTLFTNLFSNSRAVEVDRQKGIFEEARRAYEGLALKGDPLFARSSAVCVEIAEVAHALREEIGAFLEDLSGTAASLRQAVIARRSLVEARLTPALVESLLSRESGGAALALRQKSRTEETRRLLRSEVELQVERALRASRVRELEEAQDRVSSAAGYCRSLVGVPEIDPGLKSACLDDLARYEIQFKRIDSVLASRKGVTP